MLIFSNPNPIEVNEGDGQVVIEIDPIASGITEPTEVEISTVNGSAISTPLIENVEGVDFGSIQNLTTIIDPNNADTFTFSIDIIDDAIAESDESFQLQITSLEDEDLNGITSIVITDNEAEIESELVVEGLLPEISIDNVEQLEGDTGNTNFEFTVSLSEPSEEVVTVDFFTLDGTAESEDRLDSTTIVDLADYIPLEGTLEFEPGSTEKTITVEVLTDTEALDEENPDETFFVNLSNANNGDIEQIVGLGIILDDDLETGISDELPFLRLDDQAFIEGDMGEDIEQNFTVSLVDASGESFIATENISFSFGTVDVTTSATVDYEFIESEVATIVTGQSSTEISITTIGDGQTEIDETLFVILSDLDPNLVQFSDGEAELTAEVVILNDDAIVNEELEDNTSDDDLDETEDSDNLSDDTIDGTVFRFFDSTSGAYFYTASETERDFVEDNLDNFALEDSSFASVDPNSTDSEVDIFRFFNSTTGGYLYTGDATERDFVSDNLDEFVFEGVAFSAFETNIDNSIPVYRFFETGAGVHFYTANETERVFIEDNLSNFNFEGIAFYALPLESEII